MNNHDDMVSVDRGPKQRARADGSALSSPLSSAWEQMASRCLDGGNKAAAPAVTTSSDSGRAQDWQQQQEQLQQQHQSKSGEEKTGAAAPASRTHAAAAQRRAVASVGDGAAEAHRSAASGIECSAGASAQESARTRGGVGDRPAADESGGAPGRGVVQSWAVIAASSSTQQASSAARLGWIVVRDATASSAVSLATTQEGPRWAARDVTQRRLGEKLGAMKRRETQSGKKHKYQKSATTAAPRTRCSKIVE